jgi:hypothetical protein
VRADPAAAAALPHWDLVDVVGLLGIGQKRRAGQLGFRQER